MFKKVDRAGGVSPSAHQGRLSGGHSRSLGRGVRAALPRRLLSFGDRLQEGHEVAGSPVPGVAVVAKGIVGEENVPPVFAVQLEYCEVEELGERLGGGEGGKGGRAEGGGGIVAMGGAGRGMMMGWRRRDA